MTCIIPLSDRDRWSMNVDRANIYQTWEYAQAVSVGGEPANLLVGDVCDCRFVFPFVPESRAGSPQAASLYGYSGVAFDGDPVRALDVREEMKKALSEAGFAKAFIRWGVEAHTGKLFNGDVDFHAPIRRVPLMNGPSKVVPGQDGSEPIIGSTGLELVFGGGDCSKHRSQVARGKKAGIVAVVQVAPSLVDSGEFNNMYTRTMDRVGAEKKYYFSMQYFALLRQLENKLVLVRTEKSMALFLVGRHMAYYHLSAREDDAHNTEIHVIFDAIAKWAMDQGLSDIVLGGGTTGKEDDSLYLFKSRIGRCLDYAEFTEIICTEEV